MTTYQGYTLDTNEDWAAADFLRKFGAPPDQILESGGGLLVGPIPGSDSKSSQQLEMLDSSPEFYPVVEEKLPF